ncbi:MAG TPA: hypothetical protein VK859_11175, partial [bacterium]|nr:hypothetical protein [bacterium]
KAHQIAEEQLKKNGLQKVNPAVNGENSPSGGYKPSRYLKDGSLEKEEPEPDESPLPDPSLRHIDFKA